jgi:transcriptional regulator with PAS, ATPase and Fis domain
MKRAIRRTQRLPEKKKPPKDQNLDISVHNLNRISDFIEVLSTVIDEAYEGIIILDKRGYVQYSNKKHAEYMRIPQRAALHSHISEITHDDRIAEGFMEVLRTGEPDLWTIFQAHGREFVANRVPIMKDGNVIGVAGIILFDIKQVDLIHNKMSLLENQLRFYKEQLIKLRSTKYTFEDIIGESKLIRQVKKEARKAAGLGGTILLVGESGTGKELFAHAIHNQGRRRRGPFISVNCAAIPRELLESELFGYEPGSFTGASKKGKKGKFEHADKGSILLDEVGDMPLEMQSQLLRVLQEKEVERIGGNKPIKVDFRLIAATNRNLEDLIKTGSFREDLFYRLNVVRLELPPLRSRTEDIPLLAEGFLNRLAKPVGMEKIALSRKALAVLQSYRFPGNVRELFNILERVVNKTDFGINLHGKLTIDERDIARVITVPPPVEPPQPKKGLKKMRMQHEVAIIKEALDKCGGNLTQCAKLLGISRAGVHRKIKMYGLQSAVLSARKNRLENLLQER